MAKRVAVIGAGPSGLAAARHFGAPKSPFECQVFEQSDDLGGTWRFSEHVGTNPSTGRPVHSSMYKNLRTNLPKEVMSFPDFPFNEELDKFLTAEEVMVYLHQYADAFNLRPLIKFNHIITEILPEQKSSMDIHDAEDVKWRLNVHDFTSGNDTYEYFDAVLVANGHYNDPSVPEIEGLHLFKKKVIHSHDYRDAKDFAQQNVLVVGGSFSALDITMQLSHHAKKVTICHHLKELKVKLPEVVTEVRSDISHFDENEVHFADGSRSSDFDTVIFCTGFNYSFPFLHEACKITTSNYGVEPLYKHCINIEYPTMCFLVLANHVSPMQLVDLEVRFFMKYLTGEMALPSKEEMYELLQADQKMRKEKLVEMKTQGRKVAVVGAGPAGLAAARHFTAPHSPFECVVFEQGDDLGGTWRLSEYVGADPKGRPVHSSMYNNLRTNLPKEIMCYPDYPFPDYPESYVKSGKVLKYLEDFATQYELRQFIKMSTSVLEVKPVENLDVQFPKWNVRTLNLVTKSEETAIFDAIMVCNGHHSEPDVPELPGMKNFRGRIMHSHAYREPKPFAGQRVLVVGAGPSALDIALEVSQLAEKVTLSHHMKGTDIKFPNNVSQNSDIASLGPENKVMFKNGNIEDVDTIIFCTGYRNSFPFLHADCKITTDGFGVEPLYKHMINIEFPTMCVTGLVTYVCPFQLLDLQARFFYSFMSGKFNLLSKVEMYEWLRADQQERKNNGLGARQAHKLGSLQQVYYDDLAETAGIESIDLVVSKLSLESTKRIFSDLCNFREAKFKIVDKENYIEL